MICHVQSKLRTWKHYRHFLFSIACLSVIVSQQTLCILINCLSLFFFLFSFVKQSIFLIGLKYLILNFSLFPCQFTYIRLLYQHFYIFFTPFFILLNFTALYLSFTVPLSSLICHTYSYSFYLSQITYICTSIIVFLYFFKFNPLTCLPTSSHVICLFFIIIIPTIFLLPLTLSHLNGSFRYNT